MCLHYNTYCYKSWDSISQGDKVIGFRENIVFGTFPVCCLFCCCSSSNRRGWKVRSGQGIRHFGIPNERATHPPRNEHWPSGLFPSVLLRPVGSFVAGIPARTRLLQFSLLRFACLAVLPGPNEQDSPWEPLALTIVPHRHSWGSQMFTPSLRPTATLTASSSLKPQVVIGSAKSQSLE